MLNLKDLAKTIEKTYYILHALKIYCDNFEEIEEILPIKYILDFITNDLDSIYAKIIDEKVI